MNTDGMMRIALVCPELKMRALSLVVVFYLFAPLLHAESAVPERKQILDAARPAIERVLRQPVQFVVDRLNVDSDWALLTGELRQASGKPIDWRKAPPGFCEPDLDKMLWLVLAKTHGRWRMAQFEVCAAEPPYWYLDDRGGYLWPCGLYAGLRGGEGIDLAADCRRQAAPR